MASLLLKGVHKRLGLPSISISCSSADATNIIASTGTVAGVGSSSGRAIDRHSPRLRDPHRTSTSTSKPPRPSTSTKDSPSSDSSKTKRQHGHGNKKKKSTTAAAGTSEKRLVSPATSSRFLLNSSCLQSDDLDVLALPRLRRRPSSTCSWRRREACVLHRRLAPSFLREGGTVAGTASTVLFLLLVCFVVLRDHGRQRRGAAGEGSGAGAVVLHDGGEDDAGGGGAARLAALQGLRGQDATNIIASTGTVAGVGSSSGRAIDRHSPRLRDPHRSSTSKPPRPSTSSITTKDSASLEDTKMQQNGHGSKKKKKKSTTAAAAGITGGSSRPSAKRLVSPATSSRFLLNSSRLLSDDLDVFALPPPPPSFIDVLPGGEGQPPSFVDASTVHEAESSSSSGTSFPADLSLPSPFAKEAPPSTVHQAESSSSSGTSSASSSSEISAVQEEEQQEKAPVLARSSSSTTTERTRTQVVVVLRVSLHCKGCAGKVKKHIAKMEGVTSFDIDIASKKVTVVGDVTPLGVLTSVSKVKPAQFWPSQPCPPRASASF
ncbi:hypothetical protein ZWY2020_026122 [Hordeum vulgare]|nr:hypothetical protein ZWY2020_026122 [Hordeum vulgare]